MEKLEHRYTEEDEITLKELILKIHEFWIEIWKHKLLVIGISALFSIGMLMKVWKNPMVYPAKLTFMVNDDEGSGMGGVASILGQFGFGGGGGGKYNLNKLLELSRSRKIVSMVLFEKTTIETGIENKYVANHIIDLYKFHKKWKEDTTGLKNFYFKHDNLEKFSRTENHVLQMVYSKMIGNATLGIEGILKISVNEKTNILSIGSISLSESLSINLPKILYKKLSKFYIEKTIAKQKQTYNLFKSKADSIQTVLNTAQYNLLKFSDSNRSLSLQQYSFKKQQLQQEVQKMILTYGEVYKNLELSEFALKNKTPFITTIDEPIAPIQGVKESKFKALIIGGFIGGFLIVLLIVFRKIIRSVMDNE